MIFRDKIYAIINIIILIGRVDCAGDSLSRTLWLDASGNVISSNSNVIMKFQDILATLFYKLKIVLISTVADFARQWFTPFSRFSSFTIRA